jgi:Rne/Rng family ribonuclease
VAEGKNLEQLQADVKYLTRLWSRIQRDATRHRAPYRIHQELDMTASLIRDLFRDEVDSLVIDNKKAYQQTMSYLGTISPEMKGRVKLYQAEVPLFEAHRVEGEIEKTLQRRVNLRRGGFIAIDHTEALVAIDVNTGRYRGGRDQEETILRTNLEAAEEIARQLRLRDLGGIIVTAGGSWTRSGVRSGATARAPRS